MLQVQQARSVVEHLLEIVEIEKTSEKKTKEMKVFEGANEKLKQAALSFRKEDYTSTFHNLNTAACMDMLIKPTWRKFTDKIAKDELTLQTLIDYLTKNAQLVYKGNVEKILKRVERAQEFVK